ncbi:MAG: hypothetical protein ACI3YF_00155 [Prevotella sp.]
MKKIIIMSCMVLLIVNLLFGTILSFYSFYNVTLSCAVIVVTGILLYLTDIIQLKDGYKVSLMLLFAITGVLEFVISLIAPNRITDNWWLILLIALMAIEVITLIITNTVSKKIK